MIRKLMDKDLPAVVAIELATQKSPWSLDTFQRCLCVGYEGWVIESENNVCGFIITTIEFGESHILNLCVDPLFQHQGYGRKLLIYALEQAKETGAGMAYLEVRRSNVHAIALYHKMGFNQIAERKDYYPNGQSKEDALVFAMDIGSTFS